MSRIKLPASLPVTVHEMVAPRAELSELAREFARKLMKRELEVMHAQDAVELSSVVRKIAEDLSAAAAAWTGASGQIQQSWRV